MIDLFVEQKYITEPNGDRRRLFENLRFTVESPGSSLALMGRSGSGKSTLLRVLAGLDTEYLGTYKYKGKPLPRTDRAMSQFRMHKVGMVTQSYDLLNDRNVIQNVLIGAPHSKRSKAAELLDVVGLSGYESKKPHQLSGGEAQRVAIARALVKNPAIILADEPTGALDEDTERSTLELLDRVVATGRTIIFATHSAKVAESCNTVFEISNLSLTEILMLR